MEDSSEKQKGEEIQQRHLPDDLITQHILPGLPIRPLTRFKVISKHWSSTISSRNFILQHTKQPLFPHSVPPVETLLIQAGNNFYRYSCDFDDNVVKNPTHNEENSLMRLDDNGDMFDFGNDTVHLVGCSNGLVCLGERFHGKYFILWNPCTNQSHKYYPEYVEVLGVFSLVEPHVRWGFGYISALDDYSVVRIILEANASSVRCVVHVYSLRTNTSKRMELDADQFCAEQPRLVNDTFYWITCGVQIVAYDLVSETIATHTDLLTLHYPRFDFLSVMGGCLTMYTTNSQDDIVLKIVESSGRVVSVPCGLLRQDFSDLIGFTKTGNIFVAHRNPTMLGLLDPIQNSKQSLIEFVSHEKIYIAPYVSSQISPLSPAELPDASGQAD